MAGFEVIRVYSQRAREGAAGINARAPWPVVILFWLIAIPLALVFMALLLLGVLVIATLTIIRAGVRRLRARLAGVFGGGLRNDGRRNVRVIQRDSSL